MNTILVIYDSDPDGFGSAYAAWKKFGDEADYLEVTHGSDMPEDAYDYAVVYILDLSFPAADIEALMDTTEVVIIDHHPSAQTELAHLGFEFDTTRAACVQAWEYFHDTEPPLLLEYVADRDTWKWELPHSEAINNFIFIQDNTFESWDRARHQIAFYPGFNDAIELGEAVQKHKDRLVDQMVENVTFSWYGISDNKVIPYVQAPVLNSEVGHRLLEMYPAAPFSLTSMDLPSGERKYSMRSEDHRADVGEIARKNGGGGHRNAAGFKVPFERLWATRGEEAMILAK